MLKSLYLLLSVSLLSGCTAIGLVADGIGDSKNSVFAEPLIKTLTNNNDVIRSIELFQKVQYYVINNADQTPNHSLIHGTGHDGGEFLFFPKS